MILSELVDEFLLYLGAVRGLSENTVLGYKNDLKELQKFLAPTLDIQTITKENLLLSIGIYFILALIGTVIALCVLYKISEIEGRKEFLVNIPKCPKKGYRLITFPLLLAFFIVVLYMVVTEFLASLV